MGPQPRMRTIIAVASIAAIAAIAVWAVRQPGRWEVVASYRTGLESRTNAQAHNATLAAKALNGNVILPHAELSFNRAVGSWSADRGYVKAPVSYDGELIPSWGGGVCQTSTTLYNAALLAGMEILERHPHRFPARYAPPGQDAAVAQYYVDLRLRNPYDWPLRIKTEAQGDCLTCSILSQRQLGKTILVEREIRQMTSPSEVFRSSSSVSRMRVINHGAPGMTVAVYRRVSVGERSTRSLVSQDTYPALNRLVVGGR